MNTANIFQQEDLYAFPNIRVHSGRYVNVFDINPDLITIEDIAHGLSMQCRFGGHTQDFYSVAQHSCWVAYLCEPQYALTGLMHDASEAYLMDIPKPIKEKLTEYHAIEDNLMRVIAEKFGLRYPFEIAVKEADHRALVFEWENIVLKDYLKCHSPKVAKEIFLNDFKKLSK